MTLTLDTTELPPLGGLTHLLATKLFLFTFVMSFGSNAKFVLYQIKNKSKKKKNFSNVQIKIIKI